MRPTAAAVSSAPAQQTALSPPIPSTPSPLTFQIDASPLQLSSRPPLTLKDPDKNREEGGVVHVLLPTPPCTPQHPGLGRSFGEFIGGHDSGVRQHWDGAEGCGRGGDVLEEGKGEEMEGASAQADILRVVASYGDEWLLLKVSVSPNPNRDALT